MHPIAARAELITVTPPTDGASTWRTTLGQQGVFDWEQLLRERNVAGGAL